MGVTFYKFMHRHSWLDGDEYTTMDQDHRHPIDHEEMLIKKNGRFLGHDHEVRE